MKENIKIQENAEHVENAELSSAFDKFNKSSQKLAELYAQLKARVDVVDKEMAEKNRELKEKIEESNRASQYMNSILESMHSGVVAIDLDGKVTTFNKAAEKILGVKKGQIVGKFCDLVMPGVRKQKPLLRKAIDGNKDFINNRREVLRFDNKMISINSSVTLLKEADGRVIGAVEVFKDLSEIKCLENKLEQAGELASIGEMTASVAHEIRNPLNGIKGFAALLENGFEEEDPRKRFVSRIVQGVDNLNTMVTDLLVLAKPIKPDLSRNDISEIMSEVVSFAREDIKSSGNNVNIRFNYGEMPVLLDCDRYLLSQVFFNLIKNSFQAIPGEGTVSVNINPSQSRRNGNYGVEVAITDDGVGIGKDEQSRIFEPFFSTKSKGTGLGLSLVQKIIKLHDGQIELESTPGMGTTFRVLLPRRIVLLSERATVEN